MPPQTTELAPHKERVSQNGAASPKTEDRSPKAETDLVPASPPLSRIHSLIPRSVDEALVYAKAFAGSGMFAVRSPEAALTILLTGMELGMAPAQSMRAFHVIEGKPSPSADTLQALCLARPDICKYFTLASLSDQEATFETWRVGAPRPVQTSYTADDAKNAGLLGKKNWQVNRPQMLAARAKAKLARLIYPDLTLGLYTPEELTSGEVLDAELAAVVEAEQQEAQEYLAACEGLIADINAMIRGVKASGDGDALARTQAKWSGFMAENAAKKLTELDREQLAELQNRLASALAPPDAEEAVLVAEAEDDPFEPTPEEAAGMADATKAGR